MKLTLDEVAQQLVSSFRDAGDVPPDHVCPTRPQPVLVDAAPVPYAPRPRLAAGQHGTVIRCDHASHDTRPLLERLGDLLEPGPGAPRENGQSGHKKPAAPLPLTPAALLLDDINRGALDLLNTARRALGHGDVAQLARVINVTTGPGAPRTVTLPARRAAATPAITRLAIKTLPRLDRRLREVFPHGHSLVVQVDVDECTGDTTHRPGEIETRLRSWHHRARLLTGHDLEHLPVERVVVDTEAPLTGLNGATSTATATRTRREPAYCWYCGCVSLKFDPETGSVYCAKPSCVDPNGRRPVWTEDELRRLGMAIA